MAYHIAFDSDPDAPALDETAVIGLVSNALALEQTADGAEVSVLFTDDAEVQALNRAYRGVDSPTDVLSFGLSGLAQPLDVEEAGASDGFVLPPDSGLQLGEVVVSYETAERQAAVHARTLAHELAHLVVHGVLHLLGHDHAEPEEERVMRAREDEVLTASGFPPGTAGWSH